MDAAAAAGCRTLFVGDLLPFMDEAYLGQLFAHEGLLSAKIIRNKATGAPEGYGFADFASHDIAAGVLRRYNGQKIPYTDACLRLGWGAHGVGQRLVGPADGAGALRGRRWGGGWGRGWVVGGRWWGLGP